MEKRWKSNLDWMGFYFFILFLKTTSFRKGLFFSINKSRGFCSFLWPAWLPGDWVSPIFPNCFFIKLASDCFNHVCQLIRYCSNQVYLPATTNTVNEGVFPIGKRVVISIASLVYWERHWNGENATTPDPNHFSPLLGKVRRHEPWHHECALRWSQQFACSLGLLGSFDGFWGCCLGVGDEGGSRFVPP